MSNNMKCRCTLECTVPVSMADYALPIEKYGTMSGLISVTCFQRIATEHAAMKSKLKELEDRLTSAGV